MTCHPPRAFVATASSHAHPSAACRRYGAVSAWSAQNAGIAATSKLPPCGGPSGCQQHRAWCTRTCALPPHLRARHDSVVQRVHRSDSNGRGGAQRERPLAAPARLVVYALGRACAARDVAGRARRGTKIKHVHGRRRTRACRAQRQRQAACAAACTPRAPVMNMPSRPHAGRCLMAHSACCAAVCGCGHAAAVTRGSLQQPAERIAPLWSEARVAAGSARA